MLLRLPCGLFSVLTGNILHSVPVYHILRTSLAGHSVCLDKLGAPHLLQSSLQAFGFRSVCFLYSDFLFLRMSNLSLPQCGGFI